MLATAECHRRWSDSCFRRTSFCSRLQVNTYLSRCHTSGSKVYYHGDSLPKLAVSLIENLSTDIQSRKVYRSKTYWRSVLSIKSSTWEEAFGCSLESRGHGRLPGETLQNQRRGDCRAQRTMQSSPKTWNMSVPSTASQLHSGSQSLVPVSQLLQRNNRRSLPSFSPWTFVPVIQST